MREARRAKADDPHRPRFHFVNPEYALNDPNGLCLWQGCWHLFYQARPPEDPRQHWGHAVSPNLIHWRDLPYAIGPGPEDKSYSTFPVGRPAVPTKWISQTTTEPGHARRTTTDA